MFCGCTNSNNDNEKVNTETVPVSVAIGVANTVTNAPIKVSSSLDKKLDTLLCESGSTLSVFEIDGKAYPVCDVTAEYEKGISKANEQDAIDINKYTVTNAINKKAIPKTAEIDMLYALNSMITSVNSSSYSTGNHKEIIIISNLLSTTGDINFAKNTLYVDPVEYAEFTKDQLTDASDINFTFIVIPCAGEQKELNESDKVNLKLFYKTLIESRGGKVEFIDEIAEGEVEHSSWPNVSTVEVRDYEYNPSDENIDVTLDESTLFKSDSLEWVNEDMAEEKLKVLVQDINSSSNKTIICGSTATTDSSEEQHIAFSKRRADKVADKLIELGVDSDKIISIGVGKSCEKYRVPDTGTFSSESNKARNRCVYIVSEDMDKAQYFMSVAKNFDTNS